MPQLTSCERIRLSNATRRAVAAADAGDLDAVAQALGDREAAISTATPAEQAAALDEGETIGRLLTDLKSTIAVEHNRLEQVREAFASDRAASFLNVHGRARRLRLTRQ